MRVNIYGDEFMGIPGEIVGAMREKAWEKGTTVDEYMQWVAHNIWRFSGKRIIIKGKTQEERCWDFLRKLSDLGIVDMGEMAS